MIFIRLFHDERDGFRNSKMQALCHFAYPIKTVKEVAVSASTANVAGAHQQQHLAIAGIWFWFLYESHASKLSMSIVSTRYYYIAHIYIHAQHIHTERVYGTVGRTINIEWSRFFSWFSVRVDVKPVVKTIRKLKTARLYCMGIYFRVKLLSYIPVCDIKRMHVRGESFCVLNKTKQNNFSFNKLTFYAYRKVIFNKRNFRIYSNSIKNNEEVILIFNTKQILRKNQLADI